MSIVGQNVPHESAHGHVSGESIYIDDLPHSSDELIVDYFYSPVAHGKIISLDLDEARKVEDVVGVYTHKDIPGENRFGPMTPDECLLVEDTVEFIGHPIVLIAAENRKAIKAAKKAIRIEIEELEPVLSIEDAIEKKNFLGVPCSIKHGDLSKGFDKADHVLERSFYNAGQDHFYLESQACIAYPGENDQMVIHTSNQNPTEAQEVVAQVLGLGENQVVALMKRMGGGFGGKETQASHPAAMAALVAHKTKRQARIIYNKDDDMICTGGRHPFLRKYKVGFTMDGMITALKVDFYCDGGAFVDVSPGVLWRALCHTDGSYYLENCEITGIICKTNYAPNTAFRGFGAPKGFVTIENIMEEIATYLKKDSFEIRKLNCYGLEERNTTPYGQILEHNFLPQIFDELYESSDYRNRREAVIEFNKRSKTHLKGLSMASIKFGISFNTKFLNQASSLVNIYKDGTIQVSTGVTEMGQGVNTKIQQLVAGEFGLPTSDVIIMITSTEKNNNTSATAASSGCDLNGSAAVDACRKIKARLADTAAKHLSSQDENMNPEPSRIAFEDGNIYDTRRPNRKIAFGEMVHIAYRERVSLGERGWYITKAIEFNFETGQGHPFLYFTSGCAVAEVTIDKFTGDLKVDRVDILMDIGKSINPGIDRGQLTGAFIQGMGWCTTEHLRYSDKGELLTHSPTTYKIPNIWDVPEVFNVDWIKNDDTNWRNVAGSKAVGEPPFPLAICVWSAVKNALTYVVEDEIPKLDLPATNEEILTRLTHYKKLAEAPTTKK